MANDQVTLRIGGDAAGLKASLNQSSAAVTAFGSRTTGVFSKLNAKLDNAADRALTPMTGLLLGGGIGYAIKSYNDLEMSMVRLANQANWTKEKTAEVFKAAQDASKRTGIPVNELIEGMTDVVDKTGDATLAIKTLGDTADVAQATGSGFDAMGSIASQLSQKFRIAGEDMGKWFEIIATQGDKGAFTMNDFSANAERFFAAASSGGANQENLRSYLGLVQVAMQATGDPERAMTSFESMLNTFRMKAKDIKKKTGFDVFDTKGNMKDAESILKAIYKYTNGSDKKLSSFGFDIQGARTIQEFSNQRKNTGNYKFFEEIRDAAPQAEKMENNMRKAGRVMETGTVKLNRMKIVMQEIVNSKLSTPIDVMNASLTYLAEHQGLVTAGFYLMAAAAGTLAMVKLGRMGNNVRGFVEELKQAGKTKGAVSGPGGALQGQLGVQRVFVVNWQGGNLSASAMDRPILYGADGKPITFAMNELGNAATKATGKFTLARAGLNSALSTNLGFGALSVATGLATAKIIEAADLVHQWWLAKRDADKIIADQRQNNSDSLEQRYGKKTASIGRQIDKVDDQIANEQDSFFGPDPELMSALERKRSYLYKTMYLAQKENKNPGPVDKNAEFKQAINIFIDSKTGKTVVDYTPPSDWQIDFKTPAVTTKPWLRPETGG